ncbi:MAG: alpha/beta fold hydrolase [Phenylobacterium sp.]|uniref:alpha/beta fold hydrolase n=1 Tax=Phenylobacterium sp. TaxID=1871053 RepID=UPI003919B616
MSSIGREGAVACMKDTSGANVALVIETLYQIAADPEGWEQLIEVLALSSGEEAPAGVAPDLERMADIARLVSRGASSTPRSDVAWAVLSAAGRVLGCNPSAQVVMASGLGRLQVGAELAFDDPANGEVLARALDQAAQKGGGQTILKFERDGEEEGPCFAYLVPALALPTTVGRSFPAPEGGAFALVFPAAEATNRLWSTLRESFGLTAAEARLARKLRDGRSLQEAAEEMKVSVNTLRNQLRAIFEKMGLKRQSDLVRALTELSSVAGAIEAEAMRPPAALSGKAPPVAHVRLPDGRRLAYRDYGDPAGRVVLAFHEGMGSSLLPPGTDDLAARLGLRIVCADRPGFGLSDPHPDYSFDAVADDMVELCDQLALKEVGLAAILSATPSAVQTAIRLGPRARRLLICSGRPPRPLESNGQARGPLMLFREQIQKSPWVVDTFYAIIRLQLSVSLVERVVRRTAMFSAGDKAYFEDHPEVAEFIAAYVGECLAHSTKGPADELRAFRRAQNLTAAELTTPLTIWHGEEDKLAPLQDLLDYLGDKAEEVWLAPGVGHFLALKHWDALLRRMAAN